MYLPRAREGASLLFRRSRRSAPSSAYLRPRRHNATASFAQPHSESILPQVDVNPLQSLHLGPKAEGKSELVVILDELVKPPTFDISHEVRQYKHTSPAELRARVRDATVICAQGVTLTREILEHAKNLRLVACPGTGTDHVDKEYLRERNIPVCHVPGEMAGAVSESAIAMHFALQRRFVPLKKAVDSGPSSVGQVVSSMFSQRLRTCDEQTVGVIGNGHIGRRIAELASALGMRVMVAERKNAESVRPGRTSFETTLRHCTSLFIACPLNGETRGMLGESELNMLQETTTVVNVARGDVVDHDALVKALQLGKLGGYAADVWEAGVDCASQSMLQQSDAPNLLITPHVAWLCRSTHEDMCRVHKDNVEGFLAGRPQNLVHTKRAQKMEL